MNIGLDVNIVKNMTELLPGHNNWWYFRDLFHKIIVFQDFILREKYVLCNLFIAQK